MAKKSPKVQPATSPAFPVPRLSEAQIADALTSRPEWSLTGSGDAIQRTFVFTDFVQSMAFLNKVAAAAEAAQHHPDVLLRYNKVTLTLNTHDAGGAISHKDFTLAATIDGLLSG